MSRRDIRYTVKVPMNSISSPATRHAVFLFILLLHSLPITSAGRCAYTRDELLSMKMDIAFQILLNFYDGVCTKPAPELIFDILNTDMKGHHFDVDHYEKIQYKTKYPSKIDEMKSNDPYWQYEYLSQLYDLLDGDNWYDNSGWKNKSISVCNWHGISCDTNCSERDHLNEQCTVEGVQLPGNNLRGDIEDVASVLSKFQSLKILDFNYNELYGILPDWNLPNLSVLKLWMNQLKGTIPNFTGIPKIKQLEIDGNILEGAIPDFDQIPLINSLWIGVSNRIEGTLPDFSGLVNIKQLSIYQTQIYGTLPDFSNITTAQEIILSNNLLQGTIPDFSGIPFSQKIYLYNNGLSGIVPNFGGLHNLQEIYLSGNQLRGTIPNLMIPTLEVIYLFSNAFSGSIPDFNETPKLKAVYLSNNLLNGTIPKFSINSRFQQIDISNNKLTGTIPDFATLYSLEVLDVSKNKLEGTIPTFEKLVNLTSFSAYENRLFGRIPSFGSCPSIYEIVVFRNNLNGPLPQFNLTNLEILDLSENSLFGSIPENWEIPSIQYIDLSRNSLSGVVPKFFENLYQLKSLTLSHNKFDGFLPPLFWNLPNIVSIILKNNSFFGHIGVFVSPANDFDNYIYKYENLILDDNNLYGELDWLIFNYVSNAKKLSFKNNRISKLGELDRLLRWESLDVSGNPIVGSIPDSYSRFSRLEFFGLKRTPANHGGAYFLPDFMKYTDPFNLEDKTKLYICPSIKAQSKNIETYVDLDPSYYNFEFCQCLPGYFGFGDNCIQCPRECECSDGISLKYCFASPDVIKVKSALPCPRPESCKASIPEKKVRSNTTSRIDKLCQDGYENRVCSKCKKGYGNRGGSCVKCSQEIFFSTVVIGSVGFCLFVAYLYRSETFKSAKLRIIMFHMQTLSIISSGILQSDEANNFIDVSSSVGSIQLPNLACVVGSDSLLDSLLVSFSRIPAFIILGLIFYRFGTEQMRSRAVFITLNLLFLIYYSIAREVFGVFGCTVYDNGDSMWYLNVAPWVQCSPASSEYKWLLALVVPIFALFLVAFPLFILRKVRSMGDRPGFDLEATYGFLYLPYKEGQRHWEFVIIARRIAFSFILSVIPYTSLSVFFFLLVVVIQISIWMQKQYSPYNSVLENRTELSSLYLIFASLFLALLSGLLGPQAWITVVLISSNLTWVLASVGSSYFFPFLKDNPIKKRFSRAKKVELSDPSVE